jgi:hypothetical protein
LQTPAQPVHADLSGTGTLQGYVGAHEGVTPTRNLVVMRFGNVYVPAEASISDARIKFDVDEVEEDHLPITLRISAELVPDSSTLACDYSTGPLGAASCPDGMITDMARTVASVIWSPREWDTVHAIETVGPSTSVIRCTRTPVTRLSG